MQRFSKADLFTYIDQYINKFDELPTQRTISFIGISKEPFIREFGSWNNAKEEYMSGTKKKTIINDSPITLVIPDAHISPDQDLSRFKQLNNLILDKRPDNIVILGDFITLESLSNWDLNKSGTMEGRRYQADVKAGKEALTLLFENVKETYNPNLIFIKGNHEDRLTRYLECNPELKEHLDLARDLQLYEFGFNVIEYREYYEFNDVYFTHSPMNGANQCVSGKFAIHRAAEMTSKSLVFGHCHRKESVNFYRHGADDIVQVLTAGAFFEHTDSYAYGGLNSYWRGCMLLTHWKPGRFDVEEFSLERLCSKY